MSITITLPYELGHKLWYKYERTAKETKVSQYSYIIEHNMPTIILHSGANSIALSHKNFSTKFFETKEECNMSIIHDISEEA
jgi:hypothetical protein